MFPSKKYSVPLHLTYPTTTKTHNMVSDRIQGIITDTPTSTMFVDKDPHEMVRFCDKRVFSPGISMKQISFENDPRYTAIQTKCFETAYSNLGAEQ